MSGEGNAASPLKRVAAWEWEIEPDRLRLSVAPEPLLGVSGPIRMSRSHDFIDHLDQNSQDRLRAAVQALLETNQPLELVVTLTLGDRTHEIELHAGVSEVVDGRVTRVGGVVAEASQFHGSSLDVEQIRRSIERVAETDVVTGLLNRDAFHRYSEQLLEDESLQPTMLSVRIGEVGLINETCGPDSGDELLRELAAVMRSIAPSDALLARTSGGRFCVLLPQAGEKSTVAAETIADALRDYQFVCNQQSFSLSTAIGIARRRSSSERAADLVTRARSASRLAAESGRNQVQEYDPLDTDVQRHTSDLEWSARLHSALVEGNFVLYQQPIEPLQPGSSLRLVEVLLRMRGPDGEMILPERFIPVAERYQLMTNVDRWVVREALPLLRQLPDDIGFVLNVSGRSLGETGFFSFVADQLRLSGVDPARVAFEITETAAIGDFERALRFISIYRGLGCKFMLDDVGSGTNTLFNLRQLPVDMIKIEGAFVRGMTRDKVDATIVAALAEVARAGEMLSIAESVESQQVLAQVRDLGVDYAQGFWIGEPEELSVSSLEETLRVSRERAADA